MPAPVDDDDDERAATVMADGQANAVKERAIAYNKLAATGCPSSGLPMPLPMGWSKPCATMRQALLPKKEMLMQQVLPPRRGGTRCFATRT